MSAQDSAALDLLGVLLEQLEGLTAVATQADYGELDAREIKLHSYAVHDLVMRCNSALMDHQEAQTDARIREQSRSIAAKALVEGGSVQ